MKSKSELLAELSSQISEPLIYSNLNDFEEEKHFLFDIGRALIWIIQENGTVTSVEDSDEMGYDGWLYDNNGDENQTLAINSAVMLEIHKSDVKILNSKANLELFNELVKYL